MSSFALKIIAIIAMAIDHFGAAFDVGGNLFALRVIGRLTFPIIAFFVAEGCDHTKDMKKYALRLLAFGFISELPFDMLFRNSDPNAPLWFVNLSGQNVMFTLFFGVLAIMIAKRIKDPQNDSIVYKIFLAATILFIMLTAQALNTDYGAMGVTIMLVANMQKRKVAKLLAISVMFVVLYFGNLFMIGGAFVGVLLLYFYNGERGRSMKWLFYAFYPLHLLVLTALVFLKTQM